jgi:hypothetical protein
MAGTGTAYHGKDGAVYAKLPGASDFTQVALISAWTLDMSTDTVEVTSLGDTNKTFVQGLRNVTGTLTAHWTDDTALFDMADSPEGVELALWPSIRVPQACFHGPAYLSVTINSGVAAAVTMTGNFVAKGSWSRDNCPTLPAVAGLGAKKAA